MKIRTKEDGFFSIHFGNSSLVENFNSFLAKELEVNVIRIQSMEYALNKSIYLKHITL